MSMLSDLAAIDYGSRPTTVQSFTEDMIVWSLWSRFGVNPPLTSLQSLEIFLLACLLTYSPYLVMWSMVLTLYFSPAGSIQYLKAKLSRFWNCVPKRWSAWSKELLYTLSSAISRVRHIGDCYYMEKYQSVQTEEHVAHMCCVLRKWFAR